MFIYVGVSYLPKLLELVYDMKVFFLASHSLKQLL